MHIYYIYMKIYIYTYIYIYIYIYILLINIVSESSYLSLETNCELNYTPFGIFVAFSPI